MRYRLLSLIALIGTVLLFSTGAGGESAPESDQRPNVLFILADDLGYMDVGAYNPDTFYETPNIDSLAWQGMKFTDGYVANPVCSPTRQSIMTGQHPSRTDRTNWFCGERSGHFQSAPFGCFMEPEQLTLAEAFQEAGYATWFGGKWHLGPDPKHWPKKQGFDVNKGGFSAGSPVTDGGNGYFSPYNNPRLEDGPAGEYLPFRLAEEAEQFIEDHKEEPFFAYLSFYEVHNPKQAPDSLVQKYRAKRSRMGLDETDEFEEIEQVWPVDRPRRERIVQGHPVYAAMVEALDTAVGTVLGALRENNLSKNTVVVFLSDNGGLSTSEGHNTSNRPLRGGKGWVYEGGIREPYIIHWPGVTSAGTETKVPATSMDFYPTLLEVAGLQTRPEQHKDGVSLVPALKGNSSVGRDALYWHYPHYSNQGGFPGGAIRMGPWKLVENYEDGNVRLFNIEEDIGEQRDLAEQHPGRVDRMRQRLHDWYEDVDARFLKAREGGPKPWRPGQ